MVSSIALLLVDLLAPPPPSTTTRTHGSCSRGHHACRGEQLTLAAVTAELVGLTTGQRARLVHALLQFKPDMAWNGITNWSGAPGPPE